ncbi:MAG: glycosyltransferase family 9 protein [Candidatus Omnitrophota bacterium]
MHEIRNMKDRVLAVVFGFLLRPAVWCVNLLFRHREPLRDNASIKRILIIRLDNIGDVVMVTPLIRELKRNVFKGSVIDLLTAPEARGVVSGNPYINEVIPFSAFWFKPAGNLINGISECIKIISLLKRKHYDLAIDPRGDVRNILFMYILGINRRAGFEKTGGAYMLTDNIRCERNEHLISQNMRVVSYFDKKIIPEEYPEIFETENGKKEADTFFRDISKEGREIVGVFPCSKFKAKEWGARKYALLCEKLYNESGVLPVIMGSQKEYSKCRDIRVYAKYKALNFCGKLSLDGLVSFMKRCKCVICNDSAPAHIAAALSLPVIVVWGPMDPRISAPCHRDPSRLKIVYRKLPCSFCNSIKVLPVKCRGKNAGMPGKDRCG